MSDKLSVMSGKLKDTNEKLNFTLAARAESRWVVMWARTAGGGGHQGRGGAGRGGCNGGIVKHLKYFLAE
jgi:hypothetical protein